MSSHFWPGIIFNVLYCVVFIIGMQKFLVLIHLFWVSFVYEQDIQVLYDDGYQLLLTPSTEQDIQITSDNNKALCHEKQ